MVAAYMQILIHAVDSSLYTDADQNSTTWAGPPPEIVTTQSLLYASLATSLFAAFLAMLGKQWISWYLRNRRGSAADKSRDRQRKLDGLENWHFHVVIEGLPVMLQLALLLFGCALSRHLWAISRTVAGVAIAATLLGVIAYIAFTLAATLFYNCPFQTPASLIIRSLVSHHYTIHTLPTMPLAAGSRRPVKDLRRFLRRLHSGIRSVASSFGCGTNVPPETPDIPLAIVALPRIFEETSLDWEICKADTRCVAWVLRSTTDNDMIFSAVRFAADLIWYPEIPGTFSPHILTDLFFECLLDRRVVPGRAEQASLIGMALTSVLSIQLSVEPGSDDLNRLCQRIVHNVDLSSSPEVVFGLVASVLDFVAQTPVLMMDGGSLGTRINTPPADLPVAYKLWLGRTILQTVWRWRRLQHHTTIIDFYWMASTCKNLVAEGDQVPTVLKTIWILTLTICLGATVDVRDLYPSNNEYETFSFSNMYVVSPVISHALFTALDFLRGQLATIIRSGDVRSGFISSTFSTLSDLDIPQVANFQDACISWIQEIIRSPLYPEDERYSMASSAVALLGKRFDPPPSTEPSSHVRATAIRPLLDFLLLGEGSQPTGSPPYPGIIALQAVTIAAEHKHFDPMVLPVLTCTLLPTHPLQPRILALRLFQQPGFEWCSSQAEAFSDMNRARLLEAVGDPFHFIPDPPFQSGQPMTTTLYEPMRTAILLIEFATSGLWRNHLRRSNFTSCEEIISTEEGRDLAFKHMIQRETGAGVGSFNSLAKLILAIRRLEEIECWNTAEVVILWAWTNVDVNAANHDAYGLIEQETLNYYCLRGMQRRGTLSKHIKANSRQPVRMWVGGGEFSGVIREDLDRISQTCQLRRLYQLFECDHTTWGDTAVVGKVDEVSLGSDSEREVGMRTTIPVNFLDFSCDYP